MQVKVWYENGRADLFDTTSYVTPRPFSGIDMLTEFVLKIDKIDSDGLWLEAHYYEASEEYREEAGARETPTARRKRGWRFQLVHKDEVDEVIRVDVDDIVVLRRVGEGLCRSVGFEEKAKALLGSKPDGIFDRILSLYDILASERKPGAKTTSADLVGFTPGAIRYVEDLKNKVNGTAKIIEEEWGDGNECN